MIIANGINILQVKNNNLSLKKCQIVVVEKKYSVLLSLNVEGEKIASIKYKFDLISSEIHRSFKTLL